MKHEKIQIVTFLKQGQIPDATACMSRLLSAIIAVSGFTVDFGPNTGTVRGTM